MMADGFSFARSACEPMTYNPSLPPPALHGVWTVPYGVSFVDGLAAGLLAAVRDDPGGLAGMTVLMPSRRACRSLREAFLRASNGRPLLLPRMAPVGDLDEEAVAAGLAAGGDSPLAGLAPPVPALSRDLVLARLILAAGAEFAQSMDQAVRLAQALGALIDEVGTEGCDMAALAGLLPEDYAEHWQRILAFLRIVTDVWPQVLAEKGWLNRADWRNRLIDAQIALWQRFPPQGPVIVAGSLGIVPAVARLMAAVRALPRGMLVLPALDRDMPEDIWQALDPAHPQAALKTLLERLGMERREVQLWPAAVPAARQARARLLAEALRPPESTDGWQDLRIAPLPPEALEGVARLDCADPQAEAEAIALILRGVLETEAATAMLVTPDRALARRVAAALGRWDIRIDDSAGRPLGGTPVGLYLRLLAEAMAGDPGAVDLLGLLKHPLTAAGLDPAECRRRARLVERFLLRGPRVPGGVPGLLAALDRLEAAVLAGDVRGPAPDGAEIAAMRNLLQAVADILPPVIPGARRRSPTEWLGLHTEAAERLATGDTEEGAERLWRMEDGTAAAELFHALTEAVEDAEPIGPGDYAALIHTLLDTVTVRPDWGTHPRLAILGPLEARLAHADVTVLGGLNEGSWPAAPVADPWLSRPMRQQFGLRAPEAAIGEAAHDFYLMTGAPQLYLTRAVKAGGAPTVASRWLVRLGAVLEASLLAPQLDRGLAWQSWAAALDAPEAILPAPEPRPAPPLEARPTRLSVTRVELWRRNPYGLYAERILRLSPLDAVEADPTASERGTAIHAVLDDFIRAYPDALPPDARARLLALGEEAFATRLSSPALRALWWPRFVAMAGWFLDTEAARRAEGWRPHRTEAKAEWALDGVPRPFVLTGTMDRIDMQQRGGFAIIDYKTGTVPSQAQVDSGARPQLPLEALLLREAGLVEDGRPTGLRLGPVTELAYWKLGGGRVPGEVKTLKELDRLMLEAEQQLRGLIAAYADPAQPYPYDPLGEVDARYDPYAHLARAEEWRR